MLIATMNAEVNHYGSTIQGPVLSTIQNNPPSFVTIEGVSIMSTEDLVDTPVHAFALNPLPPPAELFHSHSDQTIDTNQQNYVTIEGNIIVLQGDKYGSEDTRIDSAGQFFVQIFN
jgi:hypothetical protein